MMNKVSIGSWLTIGHTAIAELMCRSNFDWLTVDMEHSAIDISDAFHMIQVISLCGVKPLVRVGTNDPNLIKRVMDAGAYGVIVPMVNTKEEAIQAVNSVKYPPIGKRGVGLSRAQGYGYDFENYLEWVNKESIVIAQIEHIDAVNNLEEILSVEGIDGTIIGPYDLSGSLGIPGQFEDPKVVAALEKYEKISGEMGKPTGVHVVQPDENQVNKFINKGYKFIAVGLDALFLGNKVQETLNGIKGR